MASAETRKAKSRLKVLSASIDEVEAAIEPLLSGEQTLPEILLALEPLQQAKLQTALPYLVYDLIFIYLRTRGIDPKSHPVITELDRVRQYFDKIKDAENPAARTMQVDKAAANRFIKHAISQAQIDADAAGAYPSKVQSSIDSEAGPSTSNSASVRVPVKVTSKMLEREEWQKRVEEAGSDVDDEIERWEGEDDAQSERGNLMSNLKGKGKVVDTLPGEKSGSKRRRAAMDPFAGYGNESEDSQPAKKQALLLDTHSIVDPSSASSNSTPTKTENKTGKQQKAKEARNRRVVQLHAEGANEHREDNDMDITESGSSTSTSAPEALGPTSILGGKKKKDKKRK
ncbi:hypothetical protein GYMLUDRAFT_32574 [Collybiopsis luxurians FD-317 M1]|nr:hypothetical protein GYMLUDRAFT_32574 [Collybiopsis luxurians FD-317 M1]